MCSINTSREREAVDANGNSTSSHSHSPKPNCSGRNRDSRVRDRKRETERESSGETEQMVGVGSASTREGSSAKAAANTTSTSAARPQTCANCPSTNNPADDADGKRDVTVGSSSVEKKESPSDTNLQQDLRCPICMDFFIEPTITDCAHVFCHFCINYWFVNRGRSICPQCRNTVERVVPSPDLNSKVEKYVASHLSKDALDERERIKEIRRRDLNFTMDEVAMLDESIMSPYSSATGDIDDLFWAFTLQQPESSITAEFTTSVWPSAPGTSNPSAMASPNFATSFLSADHLDASQLPSRMSSRSNSSIPTANHNPDSQDNADSADNPDEGSESNLQEIDDTLHQFEYRLERAQRAYGLLLSAQREMNHQLSHLHSISCRLDRYDRQGVAVATAAAHSYSRSRNSSTQNSFIPLHLPIPIPDLSILTSSMTQPMHINPHSHHTPQYPAAHTASSSSHHQQDQLEQQEQGSSCSINNPSPRNDDERTADSTSTRLRGISGHCVHNCNPNYHYMDPNAMWYWLSSPHYRYPGSRFYPPTHCGVSHHHPRPDSGSTYDPETLLEYNEQGHGRHRTNTPFHPFRPFHEATSSTSVHGECGAISSSAGNSSNGSSASGCRTSSTVNPNVLHQRGFPRTRTRQRRRRCYERECHSNDNQNPLPQGSSSILSSHQFDPRSTLSAEFDEDFLEEITSHLADTELAQAIERSLVLDIFDSHDTVTSGQSPSPTLEDEDTEDALVGLTLTCPQADIYFQRYSQRDGNESGSRHRHTHRGHAQRGGHHHYQHHNQQHNSTQRPLH